MQFDSIAFEPNSSKQPRRASRVAPSARTYCTLGTVARSWLHNQAAQLAFKAAVAHEAHLNLELIIHSSDVLQFARLLRILVLFELQKSQFAVDGRLRAAAALGSRHAHPQLRCRLCDLGLGPGEGTDCSPLRVRAAAAAWACWNPFSARAAGMLAPRRGLPSPAGAPKAGPCFVVP